jgi:hypothetical protein
MPVPLRDRARRVWTAGPGRETEMLRFGQARPRDPQMRPGDQAAIQSGGRVQARPQQAKVEDIHEVAVLLAVVAEPALLRKPVFYP